MEITITTNNFDQLRNGTLSLVDYLNIAAQYGIRNIPTLLFFNHGEATARHTGAANKTTLKEFFEVNI